jgi:hypothetical protein
MSTQLFYLITILIFAGGATTIGLISIRKSIRKYAKVLIVSLVVAVIITPVYEPTATRYGAWEYGAAYMLNVHILGAEAETYLYSVLVMLSIACATLILAEIEERGSLSARLLWKSLVKRPNGHKN